MKRHLIAALMFGLALMAASGVAMWAGRAEAQSKLPPCPSDQSVRWHNCFGTYTFASGPNKGDKYVGEYKDDKQNGQGTYMFSDGSKYVGEYKDDKRNGQGTYTFANGIKYVGEYKDGKYNGQGTYTLANGAKYVGEWKNGERNGQGTFRDSSGSLYVGEWKDDERNGAGKELDAMGNVMRQGYYVDGAYFGPTPPAVAKR